MAPPIKNSSQQKPAGNVYENILRAAATGGNKNSVNKSYADNNSANLPTETGSKNVTGANMGAIEEGDFAGDAVFNNINHQIYINKEGKLIISDRKAPNSDELVPNAEIDLNTMAGTDYYGRTIQLNKSQHIMLHDGTNIYLKPGLSGGVDVTITNRLKNDKEENGNFMAVTSYNPETKGEPLQPVAANDKAESFERNQSNYEGGRTIYINPLNKGDSARILRLRDSGELANAREGFLEEAWGRTVNTDEDKDDGDDDAKNYFAVPGLKGGDRATSCSNDDLGGTWAIQGDEQGAFLGADHRTWGPAASKFETIDTTHKIARTQPLPAGTVVASVEGTDATEESSESSEEGNAPAKPAEVPVGSSSYPPASYPIPGAETAADRAEKERQAQEAEARAAGEKNAAGRSAPASTPARTPEPAMH